MLSWIHEHLGEAAGALGITTRQLTFLKRIGGDLSPQGKALFEVLGPSNPVPLWVIKAARTGLGNPRLRLEHQRLEHLSRIFLHPKQGTASLPRWRVPAPILYEERSSGSLSVETFLPGKRVSQLLQQHNQPNPWARWKETGNLALEALSAYGQHETPRRIEINLDWWRRRLIEPLTPHYDWLARVSPEWPRIWKAMGQATLWSYTGLTVPQHGDFTPANLVVEDGSIGIFDWSPSNLEDPPLLDLFQFLASASQFLGQGVEHKRKVAELTSSLFTEACFLEPVAQPVWAYLKVSGLEQKDLLPLSLASLGIKILSLAERPVPVSESLSGWLWTTGAWIRGNGIQTLFSFANSEIFA